MSFWPVKILTPSLFHYRVTDSQFVICLLFLVSPSITALNIHYWPLSVPFQSVCSLVLLINIVTLGSSNINYDFILSQATHVSLRNSASQTIILFFLFYHFIYVSLVSRYIILSFVLHMYLSFENQLSFIPFFSCHCFLDFLLNTTGDFHPLLLK